MVFYRSLSDSKSPQTSRTLLSILAGLNNDVVFMVSILPINSSSFSLFSNQLEIVLSAQTTFGSTVILMFHCFFLVLWRDSDICLIFAFFIFYSVVCHNCKIHEMASSFISYFVLFYFIHLLIFVLAGIWIFFSVSKFQRILWVLFSRVRICI